MSQDKLIRLNDLYNQKKSPTLESLSDEIQDKTENHERKLKSLYNYLHRLNTLDEINLSEKINNKMCELIEFLKSTDKIVDWMITSATNANMSQLINLNYDQDLEDLMTEINEMNFSGLYALTLKLKPFKIFKSYMVTDLNVTFLFDNRILLNSFINIPADYAYENAIFIPYVSFENLSTLQISPSVVDHLLDGTNHSNFHNMLEIKFFPNPDDETTYNLYDPTDMTLSYVDIIQKLIDNIEKIDFNESRLAYAIESLQLIPNVEPENISDNFGYNNLIDYKNIIDNLNSKAYVVIIEEEMVTNEES